MCGGAMMLASAGMQATMAMRQAEQQKDAYNYEAQVARNNATLAEYQARDAIATGQENEQKQRLKTAGLKSSQRAAMAANGIDLGVGSANDVLTSTDYMGERDALTIRNSAAKRAWAYGVDAQGALDIASMKQASSSAINPTMAAATSLLGSAGEVSASWYKAKGAGASRSQWLYGDR